MGIKVEDYIDVRAQAISLGLPEPSGLTLLPRHFADAKSVDEFVYDDSIADVQRLMVADGVGIVRVDGSKPIVLAVNRSHDWIVPAIYASALAFQQAHPDLFKTIIATIQAQAKRIFRGVIGTTKVKLEIVLDQPGRGTKKVSFEGPPDELSKLQEFVTVLQEGAKDDDGRCCKGG